MANTDSISIRTYHTFDVINTVEHKNMDAALKYAATKINMRISVYNNTTGAHTIMDGSGNVIVNYPASK